MKTSMKICRVLLWLCVIWLGLEIGAGIFEIRVIVPLWASAPPESTWAFNAFRNSHPEFALDAGNRFWIISTPGLGLVALFSLPSPLAARIGAG